MGPAALADKGEAAKFPAAVTATAGLPIPSRNFLRVSEFLVFLDMVENFWIQD
jgi:hypothetical protein